MYNGKVKNGVLKMTITIKPTKMKHSSGYRRIQIKTDTTDTNCSDVIHLIFSDNTSILMDSENGEIRLFSNYYDFKIDDYIGSDAFIRCERKIK